MGNSSNNPQCDSYVQNGLGASKEIATAESPEAKFNLNPEQCISENIEAINNDKSYEYWKVFQINLTINQPRRIQISNDTFVLWLYNQIWISIDIKYVITKLSLGTPYLSL